MRRAPRGGTEPLVETQLADGERLKEEATRAKEQERLAQPLAAGAQAMLVDAVGEGGGDALAFDLETHFWLYVLGRQAIEFAKSNPGLDLD